jgi:hypothetical protein
MKVLIDTSVWSKVLRADDPDPKLSKLLKDLIVDNRVVLTGPILQEILSGIRDKKDFQILEERLSAFDDLLISKEIYIKAAEYFNICKMHGINGGHIDFLICAIISHYNCVLLTTDRDFKMFQKHLPIKLLDV